MQISSKTNDSTEEKSRVKNVTVEVALIIPSYFRNEAAAHIQNGGLRMVSDEMNVWGPPDPTAGPPKPRAIRGSLITAPMSLHADYWFWTPKLNTETRSATRYDMIIYKRIYRPSPLDALLKWAQRTLIAEAIYYKEEGSICDKMYRITEEIVHHLHLSSLI